MATPTVLANLTLNYRPNVNTITDTTNTAPSGDDRLLLVWSAALNADQIPSKVTANAVVMNKTSLQSFNNHVGRWFYSFDGAISTLPDPFTIEATYDGTRSSSKDCWFQGVILQDVAQTDNLVPVEDARSGATPLALSTVNEITHNGSFIVYVGQSDMTTFVPDGNEGDEPMGSTWFASSPVHSGFLAGDIVNVGTITTGYITSSTPSSADAMVSTLVFTGVLPTPVVIGGGGGGHQRGRLLTARERNTTLTATFSPALALTALERNTTLSATERMTSLSAPSRVGLALTALRRKLNFNTSVVRIIAMLALRRKLHIPTKVDISVGAKSRTEHIISEDRDG